MIPKEQAIHSAAVRGAFDPKAEAEARHAADVARRKSNPSIEAEESARMAELCKVFPVIKPTNPFKRGGESEG